MRYTRIQRGDPDYWVNIGEYIKLTQPIEYQKLKPKRDITEITTRAASVCRRLSFFKNLMQERTGVRM